MKESKEKIKSRMIKNASRLWGYADSQLESSFDPLIGMIIGSLAGELEKVSEEIAGTESRVVERLVELLTPEPITGPSPSHALIKVLPTQPHFTIGSSHQFYAYKNKPLPGNPSKTEEKSVFFTPSASSLLFKGQVKYIAAGRKLFELHEELNKDVRSLARSQRPLQPSTLWIGMELDDEIRSLAGLSLCFELKNAMNEEAFYRSLARGNWFINGHAVKMAQGFSPKTQTESSGTAGIRSIEMNICARMCNHVNDFYQKKFISLSEGGESLDQLSWAEKVPRELTTVFNPEDLKDLGQKLYWIKAELPDAFPAETLEDVSCYMNCFPVINRRLNEFTQTSREFINIIPLQTEDILLDIKNVSNIEGKLYTLKSFSGVKDMEKGTYILRQGGVGRFDKRNAMEILDYLLKLLRDESAAFSVLGSDMISSNLRELNQMIARLEQRLGDSNVVKEDTSYLALRAKAEDETVFVEFWSTQGAFANNIKAGSKLNIYEGSDIEQDSVILITPTVGGRERLDTQERINAYRKTVLSNSRVVTAEDIKAFCYEHFGDRLKTIEIRKGLMKSMEVSQGFMRTIDIHITLSKEKANLNKDEIKFLEKDLLVKLEAQSSNVMPFRCFLK